MEKVKRNWEDLVTGSDTKLALELLRTYKEGDFEELGKALELNYESFKITAETDLLFHLSDLMLAIILLKFSDEYKTQQIWEKILRMRREVEDDLEWNHNLSQDTIKKYWNEAFESSLDFAKSILNKEIDLKKLSPQEVFEVDYHPSNFSLSEKQQEFRQDLSTIFSNR